MEIFALLALFAGGIAVLASGGDDEPSAEEDSSALNGTDAEDRLQGSGGDDLIVGAAADDVILGGDGNDTLAGDDADLTRGGKAHGADLILGGAGDDLLGGNGGLDTLNGGLGDDEIIDFDLSGTDDQNQSVVDGGAGDDTIFVQNGSTITGGSGADLIQIFLPFGEDETTEITDFDPTEDALAMVLEASSANLPPVNVQHTEEGAEIWLADQLLARLNYAPLAESTPFEVGIISLEDALADNTASFRIPETRLIT